MKILFGVITIVVSASLITISIVTPEILSKNTFLANFINHEILNILAVIVTVTLVSITQVHLEFGRIERRLKEKIFPEARREINQTTWALGLSFILVLFALILRGGVEDTNLMEVSLFNSFCLIMLLIATLSMIDVVHIMHVISDGEPIDDDTKES